MPVVVNEVLDNANKIMANPNIAFQKKNVNTPHFFSSQLTGNGKTTRGLLIPSRNPASIGPNGYNGSNYNMRKKSTVNNGNVTIYNIPVSILYKQIYDDIINILPFPNDIEVKKIASHTDGTEVYLWCPIANITVTEETAITSSSKKRDMAVIFHTLLYFKRTADADYHKVNYISSSTNKTDNTYYDDYSPNLLATMKDFQQQLKNEGYTVDANALNNFYQNYDIYSNIVYRATDWNDNCAKIITDVLIRNAIDYVAQNPGRDYIWKDVVGKNIAFLETYPVSLPQYKDMYDTMHNMLSATPEVVTQLCKYNLNLLLSNMLKTLDDNKALLYNTPKPATPLVQATGVPFSKNQMAAITTEAPLVLVQSGAGTGKSTVINGRMNYMNAAGIDMKDITVLSFTNAAANHITDLQPNVNSMTIDRMMYSIYSENFSHELSKPETIYNSLDIFYDDINDPDYEVAMGFKNVIHKFCERRMPPNAFTKLNNFIEENLDAVIRILDKMNQTSLEIISIICYQMIDTLKEPDYIQTKHLIIDEVQDNSVFNFIYTIKYTLKHNCSMFIVGDCSQTLYEFRASNPKALNVLEASGIFETHKLQINYRSNQAILDFANILLGNIEANQFANIQLQSNNLQATTLQSFEDSVHFKYDRLNKLSDFKDLLPHIIAVEIHDYIKEKYDKGEQVCFLAWAGDTAQRMQDTVQHLYPNAKCINLRSERVFNSTIFTQFIARYWKNISFVPPTHIMQSIKSELNSVLQYLPQVSQKKLAQISQAVNRSLWEFEKQYGSTIINWENQVINGQMTQDEMLSEVKKLMIKFEITKNAIKQAVVSERNAENKKSQDIASANFLFSTIHGVKGLEFDNVVVVYQNDNDMAEDQKRLYYVAFTRAKKSEYIIAYDTLAKPRIEADYGRLVSDLQVRALQQQASATVKGTEVDELTNTVITVENEGETANDETDSE